MPHILSTTKIREEFSPPMQTNLLRRCAAAFAALMTVAPRPPAISVQMRVRIMQSENIFQGKRKFFIALVLRAFLY